MGQRLQAVARIVIIPFAYIVSLIAGSIAFFLLIPIFLIDILLQLVFGKEGFTADNPAMAFLEYQRRVLAYVSVGEGSARDTAPKWTRD